MQVLSTVVRGVDELVSEYTSPVVVNINSFGTVVSNDTTSNISLVRQGSLLRYQLQVQISITASGDLRERIFNANVTIPYEIEGTQQVGNVMQGRPLGTEILYNDIFFAPDGLGGSKLDFGMRYLVTQDLNSTGILFRFNGVLQLKK
jgi:hypothetical protein